ncbi:MAG: phospholipase C, phosphocholine-specific [Asticcacaulis sp.]|uniref:phosphocholine-specific phospholipase C n=1 Tax=Asticcacaulis sp. TaxID=1872648 RepID=UPI0039E2E5E6
MTRTSSPPSGANRRQWLQMAAAGLGTATLASLQKAMATPANNKTGTIMDVEHVVIFMQENRAFDHYFGTFAGVRGQGDPRPLRLRNGHSAWRQPSDEHPDGYVMPYWADSKSQNAYVVGGGDQGHEQAVVIVNGGHFDQWGVSRQLHNRMTYYRASDLPYYHALASNFTILDAYHCSTLTQTYPNRLHLWTGCNGGGKVGGDPRMDNYGEDETPSANMDEDRPMEPHTWTTYAERLEKAGVSWKVYQEYDNFGDNILHCFASFRPCDKASNLYKRGRSWVSEHKTGPDRTRSDGQQLVEAFRADLASGKLPQVSWVVTAAALSEHPSYTPADGENVCAKMIEALTDHPEVFAKTVFIINYDEAGGLFDHMLPPSPPADETEGWSGVNTDGEFKDYNLHPSPLAKGRQPLGLGIRVPAIVVSPWSRGGYVCSEVFDHISTLKFLERRFGVKETNISDWRRAVSGDLTSAFDFQTPNADLSRLNLPSTDDYKARLAHAAAQPSLKIPQMQGPGGQSAQQRPARPLPYALNANVRQVKRDLLIDLGNTGSKAAVFTIHDYAAYNLAGPWRYTLDAGQTYAAGHWNHKDREVYDLAVHGPNGFYRHFAGRLRDDDKLMPDPVMVVVSENARAGELSLALQNTGAAPVEVSLVSDPRYSQASQTLTLPANGVQTVRLDLAASDHWYDLTLTVVGNDSWLRRYAGHIETGRASRTDPGIGAMVV